MIIYPAVDIQKGKAVRLRQGQADQVTVFHDDPVSAARHWQSLGAKWLHVVDLDGAFQGKARSFEIVRAICQSLVIPVQLGGGIRDAEIAKGYLEAGVSRLIIGTMALEDPKRFQELCQAFPQKIGVSLDADQGVLKTRGWVESSKQSIEEVLPRLAEAGASFLIYTDISRDGMQSGANIAMLTHLAEISPIPLLAAGGIATLADIQALYPISKKGRLTGVISGRALYEGSLDLTEANAWLAAQEAASKA
ncbi:MAG: 1-(5-phosphoribosyl)-5-[(5-phosphoribosylamino)methylideneamino]imidazole-4-carboxamide isomerase [Desulfovibrio sp.]|nr:1-(5-phosphoribosyl)-5-[(5-phosphoribosylamino)methylideneamino]imidazole-4-carboxamide isomerase [Desulfovibrio sp.]